MGNWVAAPPVRHFVRFLKLGVFKVFGGNPIQSEAIFRVPSCHSIIGDAHPDWMVPATC